MMKEESWNMQTRLPHAFSTHEPVVQTLHAAGVNRGFSFEGLADRLLKTRCRPDGRTDSAVEEKCIILTGERGTGKSTICLKVSMMLGDAKYPHAGIVSTAVYTRDGQKAGFLAEDVATGERWPLGRKRDMSPPDGFPGGDFDESSEAPVYGPYVFFNRGFERAVERILASMEKHYRLIILDEIGPLELEMHRGFWQVYTRLGRCSSTHLLLVVRPALVDSVRSFLGRRTILLYTVDYRTRDLLPAGIARLILSGEKF